MLYPLKFNPIYKEIIWGGRNISEYFGRKTPFDKTAESWEICERPEGMSVVSGGALSGRRLDDIISEYGEKLLGKNCAAKYKNKFPLLIKIIDANDRLSVQVHPDDAYAIKNGEENGKNELWYIIAAKPDAKLIYGLKSGIGKEEFANAISLGSVSGTLRTVPVKAGDALYIPAGTVHAILDGILIAEIQQNSNTTYRIYDWDRVGKDGKPRELHIKKAMDVINFSFKGEPRNDKAENARRKILRSGFFNIDEVDNDGKTEFNADGSTFFIIMNFDSPVTVNYAGGKTRLDKGDTVLIPACLGKYEIEGRSKLLLSWI